MEPHLPGTAKVVATDTDSYRVSMKIKMGFLRPTVNADVQLSSVVANESFSINLSGKSMGAGVSGEAEVTLSAAEGESPATRIAIVGSVESSGLLNKVGDSKIEQAAVGFLESYFSSVEQAAG
jgi:carbon monoxide dehydrogenase subunit G